MNATADRLLNSGSLQKSFTPGGTVSFALDCTQASTIWPSCIDFMQWAIAGVTNDFSICSSEIRRATSS